MRQPEDVTTTSVWVVRHGETEWSKSGQHTGRTDVPLTAEGERSALALKPALAELRFDTVVSSPRQRARRTAELLGFGDVDVWDDLVEWDYGDYEGRTRRDIHQERPDWSVWSDGSPGGESPEQVSRRADEVVQRLRDIEGDVLVFSHGHFLRALAARWLDQPITVGAHLELATTRFSILGHDRGVATLRLWNAREPG